MPTGLRAEVTRPEPTLVELAQAEVRRLQQRRAELPDLMRQAAQRGAFQLVAELRLEYEQLPIRLWAAEYTAVHCAIQATRPGADRADLNHRARELAMEVRPVGDQRASVFVINEVRDAELPAPGVRS
jgi:hypothetical protein